MPDAAAPYLDLSKGARGRFKSSDVTFEIIDTTSTTSTIKTMWGDIITLKDTELRELAVGMPKT